MEGSTTVRIGAYASLLLPHGEHLTTREDRIT